MFEEFGLQSFYAAPAPVFSMRRAASLFPNVAANHVSTGGRATTGLDCTSGPAFPFTLSAPCPIQAGSGVIVDAGFSFTHIVPFFDGQPLLSAVKRINVGGKAQTNYLKELVSYRSLNMMDETYLMETIKDQLCFVSQVSARSFEVMWPPETGPDSSCPPSAPPSLPLLLAVGCPRGPEALQAWGLPLALPPRVCAARWSQQLPGLCQGGVRVCG